MSSIQADIKQIFLQDEQNRRIFFLNRNVTARNVTFLNKMQANNVHLQGRSPGLVVK